MKPRLVKEVTWYDWNRISFCCFELLCQRVVHNMASLMPETHITAPQKSTTHRDTVTTATKSCMKPKKLIFFHHFPSGVLLTVVVVGFRFHLFRKRKEGEMPFEKHASLFPSSLFLVLTSLLRSNGETQ